MIESQKALRESILKKLLDLELFVDEIAETQIRNRLSNCIVAARREIVDKDYNRETRAEHLLREMFMKCRDSQNVNQHNPYSWAELNPELMQRLKEFM
jgi:hypothetical protein